ncbi:ABC transporter ATP-binding protein [Paenibacillus sp.]|uniref:ABC transporter ATP-binding protein n=1 Tax=Paenibacillus sp. TaxID=58172 RepID=UPI002D627359|nr:ABC transporter ATP-binding protein [Paenibacillus sp.]HZG86888.1 ABC transporter ATP-binding protein [Paenibacillus sp.]
MLTAAGQEHAPALRIRGLRIAAKARSRGGGACKPVVRHLDLDIRAGEMVALVGESGSGKSVTASAIAGLLPNALSVEAGSVQVRGKEVTAMGEKELRGLRGSEVGYVFQNYQGSFSPFAAVGAQMAEAYRLRRQCSRRESRDAAMAWLERVQLPADRAFRSYPFQLSGGQLQRASLAAALLLGPPLIVADEPTTALDAVTGEHILELLERLRRETGCAVLLISHDLSHVFRYADRTTVMYGGAVLESGPTADVRRRPLHPYTKLLLEAKPPLAGARPAWLPVIPGEPGAVAPRGCPFALRCERRSEACDAPPPLSATSGGHAAACHHPAWEGGDGDGAAAADRADFEVVYA